MTNNKRKWKAIGASLCAMALAISTGSMALSAASPSGNDEIAMTQSVQSKECQVRQNETTGKVEMSLDNGKTWEEAKETDIQFASEVSTAQARQAEDGKIELSEDGGAKPGRAPRNLWKPFRWKFAKIRKPANMKSVPMKEKPGLKRLASIS